MTELLEASPVPPPARSRPAPPRPALSAACHIAIAVGSFLFVANLLRAAVPWPEDYGLRVKMAAFERHRDELDAVYVGSSRVQHAFRPTVVDPAVSRALGRPFASFNLGIGGMRAFEADNLLEDVLGAGSRRLRYAFVEPQEFDQDLFVDPANAYASRVVRWHDPARTFHAARLLSRRGDLDSVEMAWVHVKHLCWWLGNYGTGPEVLDAWFRPPRDDEIERAFAEGGRPGVGDEGIANAETRDILKDPAAYAAELEALPRWRPDEVMKADLDRRLLDRQMVRAAGAGARLVWVVPPMLRGSTAASVLSSRRNAPPVLRFNDPAAYPALYAIDGRIDRDHLNEAGAVRFSEAFAERAAPLIEALERAAAGGAE